MKFITLRTIVVATLIGTWLWIPAFAQAEAKDDDTSTTGACALMVRSGGQYAEFNNKQCKIANEKLRTNERQVGESCVCQALLNVAFDLGISGNQEELESNGYRCDFINFGDLFGAMATSQELAGKVAGGMHGYFVEGIKNAKPDLVFAEIVSALEEGRVVAISLNMEPVYEWYATSTGTVFDKHPVRGISHAVQLRAVLKNQDGTPAYFILVDSSGPTREYAAPYSMVLKGYKSIQAIASRGVYISSVHRKPQPSNL